MADNSTATKRHRGFAAMDPEQQRAIASQGGKAAHAKGHAHVFSAEEARTAGRKGGQALRRNRAERAATSPSVPPTTPPSPNEKMDDNENKKENQEDRILELGS